MKIKILSLVLVCLIISFCTASHSKFRVSGMQLAEEYIRSNYKPIGQQTLTLEDSTYDRVWEACENTLIRLGYIFYLSDKNTGEIRVQGKALADIGDSKGETMWPTKRYTLSILISKTNELISVQLVF